MSIDLAARRAAPRRQPRTTPPTPAKGLSLFILSIPFAWITGLSLITAAAFSLYAVRFWKRLLLGEILLLLLVFSLIAALLLALLLGSNDFVDAARAVAALYNVSIICVLLISYHAGYTIIRFSSEKQMRGISFAALIVFCANILLVIYGWASTYNTSNEIIAPTLIAGNFGDLPGILQYHRRVFIVSMDWGSGDPLPRPFGFGIYHTEGAIICAILAVYATIYFKRIQNRVLVIGVAIIALLMIASRTVVLAYFAGLFAAMMLGSRRRTAISVLGLASGLALAAVFFSAYAESVGSFFDYLITMRQGSSSTRMQSYQLSYQLVMENDPLFGLGVKPREEDVLGIPIGSHSAFVSLFTKGGLVAVTIFIVFYLLQWRNIARVSLSFLTSNPSNPEMVIAKAHVHASVIVLVWMITQDIDAVTNGGILAFSVLGGLAALVERLQRGGARSQPMSGAGPRWRRGQMARPVRY